MKKTTLALLLALPLSGLSIQAFAADAPTTTPITFYNNTNNEVQIYEIGVANGLMQCTSSPLSLCVQQQDPITINPGKSGVINLVTAVRNNQVYNGAVQFQITVGDHSSINSVAIPVLASPSGAYALSNF